jgi:hypothetical protein
MGSPPPEVAPNGVHRPRDRTEQAAHLLLAGLPHRSDSGATVRPGANPTSDGATPLTESETTQASPGSGGSVPPARQCTPRSPQITPTRWQLSVTTAKPNPIRRDRLDHCLAGRPPHPPTSPKPTDPAPTGQVHAAPPTRCPNRQLIAAATVPDTARLSVEPGPGADYYLSLGTRPHPTPGVGQPARCWGRHRWGLRTPTRVRGQAIRCPNPRPGVRTVDRPGCGAAIGGGFGHRPGTWVT